LVHADRLTDGQIDRQTYMRELIVTFCNFVNPSKSPYRTKM